MVLMNMPRISDLDALKKACSRLGMALDKTKKSARYYASNTIACDAAILHPSSSYEIAVTKKGSEYQIQADLFCTKLREVVGSNCGKLSQAYQIESHRKIARANGCLILGEKVDPNTGNIRLRVQA